MGFGSKNTPPGAPPASPPVQQMDATAERRQLNVKNRLKDAEASISQLASSTQSLAKFQKEYERKLQALIKAADKAEEAYTSGGKTVSRSIAPQFKDRIKALKDFGTFTKEASDAYVSIEKSIKQMSASGLKGGRRGTAIDSLLANIKSGREVLEKGIPKEADAIGKALSKILSTALDKSQKVIFDTPAMGPAGRNAGLEKLRRETTRWNKELSKVQGDIATREAAKLAWNQQNFILKKGGAARSGGFTSMSQLQPTGFFPLPTSRALVPVSTRSGYNTYSGGIYPNMAGPLFGPKDIAAYEKLNAQRMADAYQGMVPPSARDMARLNRSASASEKALAAAHSSELNALYTQFNMLGGKGGRTNNRWNEILNMASTPIGQMYMQAFGEWGAQHSVNPAASDLASRRYYSSIPRLPTGVTGMGNPDPSVLHPGVFGMGNPMASGDYSPSIPDVPVPKRPGLFGMIGGRALAKAGELLALDAVYEGYKWINKKGSQAQTEYEPILAAARVMGTSSGIGPLEKTFGHFNKEGRLAIDDTFAKLGYGKISDIARVISAGGTPFYPMSGLTTSTMLAQNPLTGFMGAAGYNQAFGRMQAMGMPEAMSGNYDQLQKVYEKSIREGMKGYLPPKQIWENMNKIFQQDIALGIIPNARLIGQQASMGALSPNPIIRSGQNLMQATNEWGQFAKNPLSNPFMYQAAWTDYYKTTGSGLVTASGLKKWANSLGMGGKLTDKAYRDLAKNGGMGLFPAISMLALAGANPLGYAGMEDKFFAGSGMGGGFMSGLMAPGEASRRLAWDNAGYFTHLKPMNPKNAMHDFGSIATLRAYAKSHPLQQMLSEGVGTARSMTASYNAISLEAANAAVNIAGKATIQVNEGAINFVGGVEKVVDWLKGAISGLPAIYGPGSGGLPHYPWGAPLPPTSVHGGGTGAP